MDLSRLFSEADQNRRWFLLPHEAFAVMIKFRKYSGPVCADRLNILRYDKAAKPTNSNEGTAEGEESEEDLNPNGTLLGEIVVPKGLEGRKKATVGGGRGYWLKKATEMVAEPLTSTTSEEVLSENETVPASEVGEAADGLEQEDDNEVAVGTAESIKNATAAECTTTDEKTADEGESNDIHGQQAAQADDAKNSGTHEEKDGEIIVDHQNEIQEEEKHDPSKSESEEGVGSKKASASSWSIFRPWRRNRVSHAEAEPEAEVPEVVDEVNGTGEDTVDQVEDGAPEAEISEESNVKVSEMDNKLRSDFEVALLNGSRDKGNLEDIPEEADQANDDGSRDENGDAMDTKNSEEPLAEEIKAGEAVPGIAKKRNQRLFSRIMTKLTAKSNVSSGGQVAPAPDLEAVEVENDANINEVIDEDVNEGQDQPEPEPYLYGWENKQEDNVPVPVAS